MGLGQGQAVIRKGLTLDVDDSAGSNVALNQTALANAERWASVEGRDISPDTVNAQSLKATKNLSCGMYTVTWSTAAPSGGISGDLHIRGGSTDPGLYVNEDGAWKYVTAS